MTMDHHYSPWQTLPFNHLKRADWRDDSWEAALDGSDVAKAAGTAAEKAGVDAGGALGGLGVMVGWPWWLVVVYWWLIGGFSWLISGLMMVNDVGRLVYDEIATGL